MPAEDFLKVIDEEVTPHVNPREVMIIVSGGEPLMRKDLAQVGRALKERGYPWGMVTNGLALTEKRFRELREAGLRSITVSCDGLEEDHIWMRQHPLAFEGATRAIRLCAAENPELLLTDEQFRFLMDFITAERKAGRHVSYSCEGFLGDYEGKVRDYLYQCAAGVTVASILIDGHISACTSIRGKYYQGNIYKDSFWRVWEEEFKPYRDRSWMKKTEPCKDCKAFAFCEGNGMHLRREDGSLMLCHLHRLQGANS